MDESDRLEYWWILAETPFIFPNFLPAPDPIIVDHAPPPHDRGTALLAPGYKLK